MGLSAAMTTGVGVGITVERGPVVKKEDMKQ